MSAPITSRASERGGERTASHKRRSSLKAPARARKLPSNSRRSRSRARRFPTGRAHRYKSPLDRRPHSITPSALSPILALFLSFSHPEFIIGAAKTTRIAQAIRGCVDDRALRPPLTLIPPMTNDERSNRLGHAAFRKHRRLVPASEPVFHANGGHSLFAAARIHE